MRITAALLTCLVAGCTDTGVHTNISYDTRFGDATTMDIHVPATHAGGRPAVLLIHGGAWRFGDKESYSEAAERYAAAGYVAATINYRLVPTGTYPAAIQDCLCALSYLRAHADQYGLDPDRIAVTGYSAGGHLSALVGLGAKNPAHQPDCEWGPTAPPAAVIPGGANYEFAHDANGWVAEFLGGSYEEVPDNYVNASPLLQIGPDAPPFLIVHGEQDVVSIEGARDLADALRANGTPVRMLELGGAGHISSSVTATEGIYLQAATDMPEAWAVTLDFLDRTLGRPQ